MSKDTSVATTPRLKKQFQETLAAQLKDSLELSNFPRHCNPKYRLSHNSL